MIGTRGIDYSRGESDTCKEYSSWAVPDGALDASRDESDNGNELQATTGRVTIPDPSDTLGDPVVEQTVIKLIETVGRQQECARFRGDCTLWNDRRYGQSTTLTKRDDQTWS